MFVLAFIGLCLCYMKKHRQQRYAAPEARAFLGSAATPEQSSAGVLPSGLWRGYYHQFGAAHNMADFNLNIDAQSLRVTGGGVDEVGRYDLSGGICQGGSHIAFTKQYRLNSPAQNGCVNPTMNKGHRVEYRGMRAGQNLGQGLRGQWYISNSSSGYSGTGTFHLWPAMDGWRVVQPSSPPLEGGATSTQALRGVVFTVTDDNLCCVCLERAVNTCLMPCGHAAVCGLCACRLQPRTCPICRSRIDVVANSDGRALLDSTSQATGIQRPLSRLVATVAVPSAPFVAVV